MTAGPPRVSVIIPTLNGASTLTALLSAVARAGKRTPLEIIAIDSGSRDGTVPVLHEFGATVIDLAGKPFGHASARNRAAGFAKGEFLLFVTQDVEPVGDDWLPVLLRAFDGENVAGAFGRQVPRGASPEEAFMVNTNYPQRSRTLDRATLDAAFGPGATLFSNAFGAMRRTAWERFPFPEIVMSEDQAWARAVLGAGLSIRYVADAAVHHGHRLSLARAFRRNFDSGSSLEQLGLTRGMWGSGLSHLARELWWIGRNHGLLAAAHAVIYESVRMMGFQLGRMESRLPTHWSRRLGEAPRD